MRRVYGVLVVAVAASTVALTLVRVRPSAERAVRSSGTFSWELYGQLRTPEGNLVVSPMTVALALELVLLGAKNQTEKQLRDALHVSSADAALGDWSGLITRLTDPARPLTLRLSNRLYVDETRRLLRPYVESARERLAAQVETVSFSREPEGARSKINADVSAATQRHIEALLPEGAVTADTRVVLTSAVYLDAKWKKPFVPAGTQPSGFYVSASRSKQVPTMHQYFEALPYFEDDEVQVVELAFEGDEGAALVVLPRKYDGLPAVERSLSAAKVEQWRAGLGDLIVDVSLPKAELAARESLALAPALKALGVTDAFDVHRAELTAIADGPSLCLAEVHHRATLEVTEQGVIATGATAAELIRKGMSNFGVSKTVYQFDANHPFLMVLIDRPTGLVEFIARIADPSPGAEAAPTELPPARPTHFVVGGKPAY